MKSLMKKKSLYFLIIIVFLFMAACQGSQPELSPTTAVTATPVTLPESTAMPSADTPTPPPVASPNATAISEGETVVVFVKDGNVKLWQAGTGQSQTIVNTGDVDAVWMSPNGQQIAYVRRSIVDNQAEVGSWYEQYALWMVGSDGTNAQELVPFEALRELLHIDEGASSGIAQLAWLADNRTLIFSGVAYWVQAEGLSHAIPEGIFGIDTQSRGISILVPDDQNVSFVPSADGRLLALMSTTSLSFIKTHGSDRQAAIHTFPQVGVPTPIFPGGVWTEDSAAFILAAPTESDSTFILNYNVWWVPVDGSPAKLIASDINDSHAASFAFSPDGRFTGYLQGAGEYFIQPLSIQSDPLNLPYRIDEFFYPNLHWSPANVPYVKDGDTLNPLCPDATRDTDRCGEPIQMPGNIHALQWLDGGRFLLMTREPSALYLVDIDGPIMPIVSWQPEEWVNARFFSAPSAKTAVTSPVDNATAAPLTLKPENVEHVTQQAEFDNGRFLHHKA